jgi:serine/threonine-protein kinase RsbW
MATTGSSGTASNGAEPDGTTSVDTMPVGSEPRVSAQPDLLPYAVHLTIPAKAEYITLGRLALTGIARLRSEPLRDEVLGDLKLALTEACTNSVRHAYAEGEGSVEIVYELHADRLVVSVADAGEGFVPPDGVADDDPLSEGGLGIAIIQALSDELEIGERPAGGGSQLRFVKRL